MHILAVVVHSTDHGSAVITHQPQNALLYRASYYSQSHWLTVRGRATQHINTILQFFFCRAQPNPPALEGPSMAQSIIQFQHSRAPRSFFFYWSPPRLQQAKLVSIISHIHKRTQVVVVSNFPTFHSNDRRTTGSE